MFLTFGADEAPADVDVFVVLDAAPGGEVVGTDDAVVGQHDAARRHAEVRSVIGDRAADTPHQTTCGSTNAQRQGRVRACEGQPRGDQSPASPLYL